MTLFEATKQGIAKAREHRGLILLLYAIDLGIAFILTGPLYQALQSVVGSSGYSDDLVAAFQEALWWEIFQEAGLAFNGFVGQLLWVAVFYVAWKAVVRVGLISTLQSGGLQSFAQGIGRYGLQSIGLALCFLVPLLVGIVGVGFAAILINALIGGEIGIFWAWFVVFPVVLISWVAMLDLMNDYASMGLVVRQEGVLEAWKTGLAWPIRYGRASYLYLLWFSIGLVVLVLPLLFDVLFPASTTAGIWARFAGQQGAFLLRTGIFAAWMGSQVAFFLHIQSQEDVLIASEEIEDDWAPDADGLALT